MGRAPCCEKTGLKKGPWTAEEDQILVGYINRNGHENWRALPKQAGLLRCGKSCRLRWMNYLRPDIKRGNFSPEEEEIIISLHAELGNKWSEMAARLPGRTDNEIKNVWHTHLKKKNKKTIDGSTNFFQPKADDREMESSKFDTMTTDSLILVDDKFPEMDEGFWSEVFPGGDWSGSSDFSSGNSDFRIDEYASVFASEGVDSFWSDMFCRSEELYEVW